MKKVICGESLQEKMLESINLLCGTVKKTLGPVGCNVLIDHSNFSPFITNDGVTIAKNIESDDEVVGAILEIIKEASIKTNEVVGDGTTTTLVLLESLYVQSLEFIKKGMSPILLKRKLDEGLEIVLKEIENLKRKGSAKDLESIAAISAGDKNLGHLAYQVLKKVKRKEAIAIKESLEDKTFVNYLKGYFCKTTLASSYFLNLTQTLSFKKARVLLMNSPLVDIESISFLLNDIIEKKEDLIIVASYFDERLVEEIISFNIVNDLHVCLLKIEDYGMHIYEILKDLQSLTSAVIVEQDQFITSRNIGFAESVVITEKDMKIDFKLNEDVKKYLRKIKKEINNMESDLEKEFCEKRIAMFLNGTAQIHLGAPTKTECLEKRMRLEDALCALSVASKGILVGGGISFLKVADKLEQKDAFLKLWSIALGKVFEQILKNAGVDYVSMRKELEENAFEQIYNISTNEWENVQITSVIDPFLVAKQALINATSIAGMLLSTTSLIINEYKDVVGKESEYNNW